MLRITIANTRLGFIDTCIGRRRGVDCCGSGRVPAQTDVSWVEVLQCKYKTHQGCQPRVQIVDCRLEPNVDVVCATLFLMHAGSRRPCVQISDVRAMNVGAELHSRVGQRVQLTGGRRCRRPRRPPRPPSCADCSLKCTRRGLRGSNCTRDVAGMGGRPQIHI